LEARSHGNPICWSCFLLLTRRWSRATRGKKGGGGRIRQSWRGTEQGGPLKEAPQPAVNKFFGAPYRRQAGAEKRTTFDPPLSYCGARELGGQQGGATWLNRFRRHIGSWIYAKPQAGHAPGESSDRLAPQVGGGGAGERFLFSPAARRGKQRRPQRLGRVFGRGGEGILAGPFPAG